MPYIPFNPHNLLLYISKDSKQNSKQNQFAKHFSKIKPKHNTKMFFFKTKIKQKNIKRERGRGRKRIKK